MSLSLSWRAVLGRELMTANTPGFSKHSSHLPTGETPKNQPRSFWGAAPPHRAQLAAPATHPCGSSPHALLGTTAGRKVYLASTGVQPLQRASGETFFPMTHPAHRKTGLTANVKPL